MTRFQLHKRGPAAVLLLVAGTLGSLTSCGVLDDLISVDAPSRVLADGLDAPANAALLVSSAGADLECALAHYIVAGGLVGNELEVASTLIVLKEYDKREFAVVGSSYTNVPCDAGSGATTVGVYVPLSVARFQADNILTQLQAWTDVQVPNRSTLIATSAAYSGYAHVLLAEGMCSVAFDLGPERTRAQAFERAEERFTTAIAAAQTANRTDLLNLARVGRARARLNLGKRTEAAADARLVPIDFVFNATYSSDSPRRENAVFSRNHRVQSITIDPSFRNRTVGGVADTRFTVVDAGRVASDGVTRLWHQTKYSAATSNIPLATGDEAQLIVAEVDGGAAAIAIINRLHTRAGLPLFTGTSATEIMDQVIAERQAELFLESHHLGDLNRYNLALTPAPGVPFKDGGGTYLAQRCFPLPDIETRNNPSIGRRS